MALLVRAPASRAGIPGLRPDPTSCGSVDPGGYIYIYIYIYIYKSCTNYFFFKCVGLLETWGMVMCKYFFLATIYISDDSVCTASLILEVFDTQ